MLRYLVAIATAA